MQIRLIGLLGVAALLSTMASAGCSSTSNGGTGGASGSGGTGGAAPTCDGITPCAGSVVGSWTVTSSCLALSGDMDVTIASLGCKSIPISGSLKVTGGWIAKSDGTYVDNTATTGTITFPLDRKCWSVSSVAVSCDRAGGAIVPLGWKTVSCVVDASDHCNCTATADLKGGMGVVSPYASTSGDYTASGTTLNVDDHAEYSTCASDSTLKVSPKPGLLPITGSITFQKEGGGTGGISGTGGSGGTGGKGGSIGTGGSTGGSGGGAAGAGGKAGAGGTSATGGTGPGGSSGTAPCDIYASANTPCVAAHSTVRALLSSYTGNLYKVKRASDGMTKDIGLVGGVADSATQDTFCTGTTCTITIVYDQSGHGNFVEAETADSSVGGHKNMTASNATQDSFMLNGHKVYSLYMKTSQAYWRDGSKTGMPLGSSPQGIYMVTSGKHFGSGCCFDYGNGETSRTYQPGPTMDALNFSNCTIWGTGAGTGPWVMADLEGGLYVKGSGGQSTAVPTLTFPYVTAMEKNNGTGTFAIKGGDATTGTVSTYYNGSVPPGYNPGKKQGSIVLGSGGDCCYSNTTLSQGTFYEGAIVAGYPTDATDMAIQANIVSAGYGK